MGSQLRKQEPVLSKIKTIALRMQHRGKMLSPGTAGGEQVCQLMQFNSRKVQKEETISHFYSEEGA